MEEEVPEVPRFEVENDYQLTRQLCGWVRHTIGCFIERLKDGRNLTRERLWFRAKELERSFQAFEDHVGKKRGFGSDITNDFKKEICMLKQHISDWNLHHSHRYRERRKELLDMVWSVYNLFGWSCQNLWAYVLYGDQPWFPQFQNHPERIPVPEASDVQVEPPLPNSCEMPFPTTVPSTDSVPVIPYQPVCVVPETQYTGAVSVPVPVMYAAQPPVPEMYAAQQPMPVMQYVMHDAPSVAVPAVQCAPVPVPVPVPAPVYGQVHHQAQAYSSQPPTTNYQGQQAQFQAHQAAYGRISASSSQTSQSATSRGPSASSSRTSQQAASRGPSAASSATSQKDIRKRRGLPPIEVKLSTDQDPDSTTGKRVTLSPQKETPGILKLNPDQMSQALADSTSGKGVTLSPQKETPGIIKLNPDQMSQALAASSAVRSAPPQTPKRSSLEFGFPINEALLQQTLPPPTAARPVRRQLDFSGSQTKQDAPRSPSRQGSPSRSPSGVRAQPSPPGSPEPPATPVNWAFPESDEPPAIYAAMAGRTPSTPDNRRSRTPPTPDSGVGVSTPPSQRTQSRLRSFRPRQLSPIPGSPASQAPGSPQTMPPSPGSPAGLPPIEVKLSTDQDPDIRRRRGLPPIAVKLSTDTESGTDGGSDGNPRRTLTTDRSPP